MNDQKTVAGPMVRSLRNVMVLAICVIALALSAMAQGTPAANTKIGNQASATYTDGGGVTRTATSNAVYTTVQQVYSLTLTSTQSKQGAPGTQVTFPHTLTNTGNGNDSFTLTLGTAAGKLTNVHIYADANGDGIPDNNTALENTNVAVASGSANAYKFVVVGTVLSTAVGGDTGSVVVTAKSVGDTSKSVPNTDSLNVSGNAVLAVTKSMSANSGPTGSTVTITLTYTNNGNATATAATFTDPLPAGMSYVGGSGKWSGMASNLVDNTNGQGTAPNTIDFNITGQNVVAKVASIAPGVSGTITFNATVTGTTPGTINNTANFGYVDGGGNTLTNISTNTVPFTILQTYAVALTDGGSPATHVVTIASAAQGAAVNFVNVVTNNGTGTDTFNITVANGTTNAFPAGTTFTLYKADGAGNPVAPLIDTNGDGIADSGPLGVGGSLKIVVQANLPAGVSGGGFYQATATAVSINSSAANDAVTEKLTTIAANTVDVTNNTPRTPGTGGYGATGTTAILTTATNPSTSVTFPLYVNNTTAGANLADSFDMTYTVNPAAGVTLKSGWNVTFRANGSGACATTGAAITNTGVVKSGNNVLVCAIIDVPAGQMPGNVDIAFTATSPTSGATDLITDRVTVNTVHAVALTPNSSGQVFPNGSVVYKHVLTNNGNVQETVSFASGFIADTLTGWNSIFYQDNASLGTLGSFDANDTAVSTSTTIVLAPGATQIMFVKVSAPAGAAAGAINTTTATATYVGGTTAAQDNTTVIAGDLRLLKEQALDASCSAVFTTLTFSQADISANAVPGACIVYRITATNEGSADVQAVKITDATPAYTTFSGSATLTTTATGATTSVSAPTAGTTGAVSADIGASTSLPPGGNVVLTFRVKINP